MTTTISIGAIIGLITLVGGLIFAFSIVGMMNSALHGDTRAVNKQANEIANDAFQETKMAPLQPLMPYVIGGTATILTAICTALGIAIKFKPWLRISTIQSDP